MLPPVRHREAVFCPQVPELYHAIWGPYMCKQEAVEPTWQLDEIIVVTQHQQRQGATRHALQQAYNKAQHRTALETVRARGELVRTVGGRERESSPR